MNELVFHVSRQNSKYRYRRQPWLQLPSDSDSESGCTHDSSEEEGSEPSGNNDKFEDVDRSVRQAGGSYAPGFNSEEDESDDVYSIVPGTEEDEYDNEDSGPSNDAAKSKLGSSNQTGEFGITLSLIIHRHLPDTNTYPWLMELIKCR